jgi:ureidoglycolate dehydrogenase (NAD+)
MSETGAERIDSTALAEFAYDVFVAAGLEADHATIVTDALLTGSLRGVDTHGIVRIEPYTRKLDEGGFNLSPDVTVAEPRDSVAVVDANDGPGPVAAHRAMESAVATAREDGVGAATVTNSNHFGMAAYYTLYAAERDCIGFTMSHAGPRVAPFGGVDPFLGTNPLAYSIPTNRDFSITLDMSTSVVANATIRKRREQGEPIPDDWATDAAGRATTDPSDVHALRPVGGAKGYGLGLLVDICCGPLIGMDFSPQVDTLFEDYAKSMRIGHFMLALDVDAFRDVDAFKADIDELVARLKSVETGPDAEEIRLPGERSARVAAKRRRDGIPVDRETVATLTEVGDRYDVTFPA